MKADKFKASVICIFHRAPLVMVRDGDTERACCWVCVCEAIIKRPLAEPKAESEPGLD